VPPDVQCVEVAAETTLEGARRADAGHPYTLTLDAGGGT
jgi:hypothetical protein